MSFTYSDGQCKINFIAYAAPQAVSHFMNPANFEFQKHKQKLKFRLYLKTLVAGKSPPGHARKMMCEVLLQILGSSSASYNDNILLLACGNVRGPVGKDTVVGPDSVDGPGVDGLVSMYQRMGFEIIAKDRDTDLLSCNVWMSAKVRKLVSWCIEKYS